MVTQSKRLDSPTELEALRESLVQQRGSDKPCISVCSGTGCHALGATDVVSAIKKALDESNLGDKVDVRGTGCHGFCEKGPIIVIRPQNIFYQQVKVNDVHEILEETILKGNIIDRLLYTDPGTGERIVHEDDVPFYRKQQRLVFGNNGYIDPTSIEDYIAVGGYAALAKALVGMSPEEIIDEIKKAGLRGRGGGGFRTGVKWESCRRAEGDIRYVICNADEGDPGAYMDRSLMEGNPHSVLEGMIIGAYAVGSSQGYVYIRNEYP